VNKRCYTRLSLTYPGRSRDQRHRDKIAALLALPRPAARRRRLGSPPPARSSTKPLLSPRCSCNSPSFPFLNSSSSRSLSLSRCRTYGLFGSAKSGEGGGVGNHHQPQDLGSILRAQDSPARRAPDCWLKAGG